jgi:two-component system CheB/CheR fusion protein
VIDPISPSEFETLLDYLKRVRAFDFGGYKSATLMRRVERHMQQVGAPTFAAYQDYLEVHPEEFTTLFNTILINVTSFFRDPAAWDYLRDEVVPRIVASPTPDEAIRIWSAGCASGEEACSLAILFAEALGVEVFRERVKIYATDVDEDALTQARQGSYDDRALASVPTDLRSRYFQSGAGRHLFSPDLRHSIIYGCHDLMRPSPASTCSSAATC